MVAPDDIHTARVALGIRLAAAREALGLTQKQLAQATNYGRSSVANVETGRQNVPRTFWATCDEVLNTGHEMTDAFDHLEALVEKRRHQAAHLSAQVKLTDLAQRFGVSLPSSQHTPGDPTLASLMLHRGPREQSAIATVAVSKAPSDTLNIGQSDASVHHDQLILAVDERARELYVRGHSMLHGNHRRDIEAAQALLDRAVGRDPRLAHAIAERGYTRWRQYFAGWTDAPRSALTGALRDVEAALVVDPDSVAAHTTFIRACWDMGWHRKALDAGRSIFLRHPDSLDATVAYSRALMNAGLAELALPLADTVLSEDPTHPRATKLAIWCHLLLGQHRNAVEIARPHLERHPGDANTRWAVALASANLPAGIEYALRLALEAIAADDADVTIWLLLGHLHRIRSDEGAAKEAWSQGVSRVESAGMCVNRRTASWAANLYAALRKRDAAQEMVSYLVDHDATNGYIRYRLFHALAELGDEAGAVAMLDAAVTCGFMSVQLMRQEEIFAPGRLHTSREYQRVVRRLEEVVRRAGEEHVPRQQTVRRKE